MKKLFFTFFILGFFFWETYLYAATGDGSSSTSQTSGTNSQADDNSIEVIVTEQIPGADCKPEWNGTSVTTRKYRCTVKSGFSTVQNLLGGLIRYATYITALIGVLMIVFSGMQYATSAGDSDSQKKSIERITKLVTGLVLLMLVGLILNTVAPWIYR